MKKPLAILLILIAGMILTTCEDEPTEPKSSTVYFTNKSGKVLTIKDNSGRDMFEEVKVLGGSSKTLTYECPDVGSCEIDFIYTYSVNRWYVCICTEDYEYKTRYTFGYCPDNLQSDESKRCNSCRNRDCNL